MTYKSQLVLSLAGEKHNHALRVTKGQGDFGLCLLETTDNYESEYFDLTLTLEDMDTLVDMLVDAMADMVRDALVPKPARGAPILPAGSGGEE
jgi:hypothetical protein